LYVVVASGDEWKAAPVYFLPPLKKGLTRLNILGWNPD
jgi:hypothetical protein